MEVKKLFNVQFLRIHESVFPGEFSRTYAQQNTAPEVAGKGSSEVANVLQSYQTNLAKEWSASRTPASGREAGGEGEEDAEGELDVEEAGAQ